MKAAWAILMAGALAMLAAGDARAAGKLRIFNWDEYTAPALIEAFQRETGVEVSVETYGTYDELYEKLRDGKSGYDLVVPAHSAVSRLIAEKLIERIDAFALPGYDNIEDIWRHQHYDPGDEYSQPWHWGTTSFVVDGARWQGDIDTLAILFDPPASLKGKIGVLAEGDEVVTMALRYLRLPACTRAKADLDKVRALFGKLAGRMVVSDGNDPVEHLVKSDAVVQMAWNGDAMMARKKRPSLAYAFPREGVTVWSDVMVVPVGAPNRANALSFLSFALRPENAATQSNYSGYANAVRGSDAHLDAEMKSAPEIIVPSSAKLEFMQACPSAVFDAYRALWNGVTAKLPRS
ncbi:MAG: extracellular solute-binding protein [Alphaproteobacteria bacterium]|nr:extracellular solute-binding protein [Alphaproteobacteria bacterium]